MGERKDVPRGARIFGYLVAALLNLAMLWIAWHVLDWGWLPFLTGGWREVLPVLTLSLGATVAVNLGYVVHDPPWLRSAAGIVLLVLSVAVTVQLLRVFPFLLSGYEFPWDTVARVVLLVALVGTLIAIVVEIVKLVRLAERPRAAVPPPA